VAALAVRAASSAVRDTTLQLKTCARRPGHPDVSIHRNTIRAGSVHLPFTVISMSLEPARLVIVARWCAVAASVLLSACALHGGGDLRAPAPIDVEVPDIDTATAAPAPSTSYIVAAPSYALVASSQVSRDAAVAALRATESAFASLFGVRPPRIGFVIYDSSGRRALPPLVMPPSDLTTITMLGGGLLGPASARAAELLQGEVRLNAASAWIGTYADDWNAMLRQEGIVFRTADGAPIPHARELPDWLHVAALSLLTRSTAESDAHDWMARAIPLPELFEHRLTEGEIDDVVRQARGPAGQTALFTAEAASVLRYLRDVEGETAVADIVGESVAGLGMRDILANLSSPTTPEQLETDWRRWAARAGGATRISPETTP
jgi:hypothetical protein